LSAVPQHRKLFEITELTLLTTVLKQWKYFEKITCLTISFYEGRSKASRFKDKDPGLITILLTCFL